MVKNTSYFTFIIVCFSLIFSIGCNKIDYPNDIIILGKGGMGDANSYPMNSRISYFGALNYNLDGVEIDVQLTNDGQLIAFHNSELQLMTNLNGVIYDYTWDSLKENAQFINQKYKEYKLISVDEIIDIFPNNAFFSLDLKINNPNNDPDYYDKLLGAIGLLYSKTNRFAVENMNVSFLNQLKSLFPELIVYLGSVNPEEDIQVAIDNNFDGIVIPDNLANAAIIEKAKLHHITATIWQRTKNIQALIELQADIIQVNDVSKFK